jgi:hypothetical protein
LERFYDSGDSVGYSGAGTQCRLAHPGNAPLRFTIRLFNGNLQKLLSVFTSEYVQEFLWRHLVLVGGHEDKY